MRRQNRFEWSSRSLALRARPLLTSVATLALLVIAGSAHAAPPGVDPAAAKRAAALFKAGRAAAAAGDDKTACARFAESEEIVPAPGTQLNLGSCEAKQGHLLAAREHFRKAGAAFKPDDERRAVAVNSASDITDRLPVVTVHVAEGAPPDLQVTLDGAALDAKTLERGLELDPGPTKLVVTANGRQPRDYDLDMKEGEKRELTVDAGESTAPPPVEAPPPTNGVTSAEARASTRKLEHTLGFVGVGAGGVGIVLGSVFGILALNEAAAVKANCTASYACRPAGVSAASSGSTDGIVSTTTFILGGVFAAGGAYLLITTWGDDKQGAPSQPVVVAPQALHSGAGATATWTF